MVWIGGATFRMGSDGEYPEERPARPVAVAGFWIQKHPVTNREFASFVEATGWKTSAETAADPADYPGALPHVLQPSSMVFFPTSRPTQMEGMAWWRYVPGADWMHPTGPDSFLDNLWDHPVVHVAWDDVQAYAAWAGGDIPTEAEWELAARGGLDGADYAWGDEFRPGGQVMANTWEGRFPDENLKADGRFRTTRVGSFPPNGHGLYDMIGNVWEWTQDWWAASGAVGACCGARQARTDPIQDSCDPSLPHVQIPRKVLKGGSHLCAPSYCRRYRPAARHPQCIDTSTSHVGFRCVVRSAL